MELTNILNDLVWYYRQSGGDYVLVNISNASPGLEVLRHPLQSACGRDGKTWWSYTKEDGLWIAEETDSFEVHKQKYTPVTYGASMLWKPYQILNLGVPNVVPGTFQDAGGGTFKGLWRANKWTVSDIGISSSIVTYVAQVVAPDGSYSYHIELLGDFSGGLNMSGMTLRRDLINQGKQATIPLNLVVNWFHSPALSSVTPNPFSPQSYVFSNTKIFLCDNGVTTYTNEYGSRVVLERVPLKKSKLSKLQIAYFFGTLLLGAGTCRLFLYRGNRSQMLERSSSKTYR